MDSSNSPLMIFNWSDEETEAKGWIVIDTVINLVSGGGIIMSPTVTLEEVKAAALTMTLKRAVGRRQFGGARAGICFNPSDRHSEGVLRRFLIYHAPLLRNCWATAGDLGTDSLTINRIVREELNLPSCAAALNWSYKPSGRNLSEQLSWILPMPATEYFPIVDAVVGYGIARSILTAEAIDKRILLQFQDQPRYAPIPNVDSDDMSVEVSADFQLQKPIKPRVIIQGFGAIGTAVAYYLHNRNIGNVIGICDEDGFIVAPEGLPVEELLQIREQNVKSLESNCACAHQIQHAKKNCIVNLTSDDYQKRFIVQKRDYPLATPRERERYLSDFIKAAGTAEVFCPCATRFQVTEAIVKALLSFSWREIGTRRFIVPGASNSFGRINDNGEVVEDLSILMELAKKDVIVVPDWVANPGTVELFHLCLTREYEKGSDSIVEDILAKSSMPALRFMENAANLFQNDSFSEGCRLLADKSHQPKFLIDYNEGKLQSRYASLLLPTQQLDNAKRLELCQSIAGEIKEEEELKQLLCDNPTPVAYDGFEPCGRMNIALGLGRAIAANRLTRAGFTFIFWIADYFALLNHKMGDDLTKIRTVGNYYKEVWNVKGLINRDNKERVTFLRCSEEIAKRSEAYWEFVMDIAGSFTYDRIKRCQSVTGREFERDPFMSQFLYPCMQCADIFFLGVNVCQLRVDQRDVNVLAREYATKREFPKPVVISHEMLPGLKQGAEKMEESGSDNAIFMDDSEDEVRRKIHSAYCPPKEVEKNPCVQYFKLIVFPRCLDEGDDVFLRISERNGIKLAFKSFEDFKNDYESGVLHPNDVKDNLVRYLNTFIDPVRRHFEEDKRAKILLNKVRAWFS
eukprot:m.8201 g.8201  ORF g.8201 m.8201 type:complete len:856 (+) comp20416_c0_seq1:26-2593(+)